MKSLYQAGIVLLFTFPGEAPAALVPFPIPAAIWGLLQLFASLCLGPVRTEQLRECSRFLTALLPVLFVAPGVGLTEQAKAPAGRLPAAALIVIASSVLTLLVSGRVTQRLGRRNGKGETDGFFCRGAGFLPSR